MSDIISNNKFNKPLINFMCSLNTLHMYTSILVYSKTSFLNSIPSILLSITSYMYWSNPKNNSIMTIDETMAHFNVVFHLYNSFHFNRELPVILIVYFMIFFYTYSKYFVTINNNELSIFSHSIVVVLGNVAAIIVYY